MPARPYAAHSFYCRRQGLAGLPEPCHVARARFLPALGSQRGELDAFIPGFGPVLPGDVMEIEIEGIGVQRNPVVAEKS
ncbi:MAG: hypothetical protein ACMG6H_10415 [Acidobacteriota bacterium]